MKKIFLTLLLCTLTASAFAFGRGEMELISGNINFIYEETTVCLTPDFSNTFVVEFEDELPAIHAEYGTMTQYYESLGGTILDEWPETQIRILELAAQRFNKFAKKGGYKAQMVMDKEDAKYEIIVHIDTLDTGSAAAAVWRGTTEEKARVGGMICLGTVEVNNRETGENVCMMKMPYIKAVSAVPEIYRWDGLFSYEILCKNFLGADVIWQKIIKGDKAPNRKFLDL